MFRRSSEALVRAILLNGRSGVIPKKTKGAKEEQINGGNHQPRKRRYHHYEKSQS